MILKTEGIVLHSLKYSESSIISRIYTKELGLVSYIIKGVRNSKGKSIIFNPPNIIELVVYNRANKNLQIIKEYKYSYIYTSLPFDVVKSSITLFIVELLNKCIIEEESNPMKFTFIKQFLILIDQIDEGISILPVWFMIHFASFLGFEPGSNSNGSGYFDLHDGSFVNDQPGHAYYMDKGSTIWLSRLMDCRVEDITGMKCEHHERKLLINHLISYYQYHIEGFGKLRSHDVLESVF